MQDAINAWKAQEQPMPEQLATYYTIELLRAVDALHRGGILHMTLKPENVLLRHPNMYGPLSFARVRGLLFSSVLFLAFHILYVQLFRLVRGLGSSPVYFAILLRAQLRSYNLLPIGPRRPDREEQHIAYACATDIRLLYSPVVSSLPAVERTLVCMRTSPPRVTDISSPFIRNGSTQRHVERGLAAGGGQGLEQAGRAAHRLCSQSRPDRLPGGRDLLRPGPHPRSFDASAGHGRALALPRMYSRSRWAYAGSVAYGCTPVRSGDAMVPCASHHGIAQIARTRQSSPKVLSKAAMMHTCLARGRGMGRVGGRGRGLLEKWI